jgi:hypothetical protein
MGVILHDRIVIVRWCAKANAASPGCLSDRSFFPVSILKLLTRYLKKDFGEFTPEDHPEVNSTLKVTLS